MADNDQERRLAAILAADVVGYSRLMGEDEAGTLAAVQKLRAELIEPRITEHKGRLFKAMGDGFLAEFPSVVSAVACAAAIQKAATFRNTELPEGRQMELRIGVHLGDVIAEGGDVFGDGVNIAARIEALAPAGGVAISAMVHDHIGNRLDLAFEDMGEQQLKNIARPLRVYRLEATCRPAVQTKKPTATKPSIAILPFANMSDDPAQEYFSDGITEDIITDLSKLSGLDVVARNTMFTYKNRSTNVKQAARELGVRFVLEGSVRKVGSRVRVTAQLINGEDGNHIWAERYDRELIDIFAIQDELNLAIVDQLKIKILTAEKKALTAASTDSVEAYTYFLRGRQFLDMWSKANIILARRMFNTAIEIDPNYARAYAGVADCDSMLHIWNYTKVSFEEILSMSARALALDPELADAHASRGVALQCVGRREEATMEFERALAIDPGLYEANYFYARFLYAMGQFERAAELFERASQLRPDDCHSLVLLSMAYESLGLEQQRVAQARLAAERAERELSRRPENAAVAVLGAVALARIGERDRAKTWAARAVALDPEDPILMYNTACVYSRLGELDLAIDLLEKLVPHRNLEQMMWFKNDPDLHPIRSHKRYSRLLEMAGSKVAPR